MAERIDTYFSIRAVAGLDASNAEIGLCVALLSALAPLIISAAFFAAALDADGSTGARRIVFASFTASTVAYFSIGTKLGLTAQSLLAFALLTDLFCATRCVVWTGHTFAIDTGFSLAARRAVVTGSRDGLAGALLALFADLTRAILFANGAVFGGFTHAVPAWVGTASHLGQ